jgi:hypothetical protein
VAMRGVPMRRVPVRRMPVRRVALSVPVPVRVAIRMPARVPV